ncbi:MAG TPA: electron transfer protein with DM13 domain protein [Cyanobacteria bacterium UBA8803]|nr:electron transfer protein with DM13 domain protein [Cyanobacteria bacterium UBA9273]HBL57082.1 electron transfer protein with DM13 domain protein [Cyanobacteria bacterium UBA8803]
MKFNSLLIFTIATVLILGCSKQESVSQPSASPAATATASPSPAKSGVIKSGTFVSGEHPTQGTASIAIRNGKAYLELDESFKTSDKGPDLVVILHRSDDVIGSTKPHAYPIQEPDYVVLAPLEKFSGTQSYPIPDNINLADYKSAGIWCRKFNATFGAAAFK